MILKMELDTSEKSLKESSRERVRYFIAMEATMKANGRTIKSSASDGSSIRLINSHMLVTGRMDASMDPG